MGNCIWWMDGYNDGHDEEKQQRRGFPSKLHTSVFCHWWLRWRLNSLFLYFLSCWWKLNSFYFIIIFIFLLIYFLFLALNSPPRLAGAFFFPFLNESDVCVVFTAQRSWLFGEVWAQRDVSRGSGLDPLSSSSGLTCLQDEQRKTEQAEEKQALCSALFSIHCCSLQMGVGGGRHQFVWSAGLETHPQDLLFWFFFRL